MTFIDAVKSSFDHTFNFSGRASRSEFWKFCLVLFLINTIGQTLTSTSLETSKFHFGLNFGMGPQYSWFTNIFTAVFFIPFASSSIRRFNDAGHVFGHFFSLVFAICSLIYLWAKWTGGQVHILLILLAILVVFGLFIFITTRPSKP